MFMQDAIEGFTGRTAVVVTDAAGIVQHRVDIDFGARTMSANGATPPTSWTPGFFRLTLDAALSPAADAAFSTAAGGVLEISATGTGRISVADDPSAPTDRAGRSFSHYFGLNDLVDSTGPAFYDNGLTTADPHGFAAGGEISFRFNDGTGTRFSDVTVAVPAGGTLGDMLTVLNGTGGVAKVGAFALENGALRFTSKAQPQVALTVIRDDTVHNFDGRSLSALHGLGGMRAARAESFALRPAIAGDTNAIALAKFDFSAAVGARGLSLGDGRGAFGLAQAGETTMRFERAGEIAAASTSLSSYAAQFGGAVGRRAALASERHEGAEIVLKESAARRSSVEGVNLDEELIQLTVYQQAFSASARLITAAKEMYDVLLSIA
jgi:flagellar hook-associated protein 1 FlgK